MRSDPFSVELRWMSSLGARGECEATIQTASSISATDDTLWQLLYPRSCVMLELHSFPAGQPSWRSSSPSSPIGVCLKAAVVNERD